jgi:hypothetical protein
MYWSHWLKISTALNPKKKTAKVNILIGQRSSNKYLLLLIAIIAMGACCNYFFVFVSDCSRSGLA